jgi:hypothetical protein
VPRPAATAAAAAAAWASAGLAPLASRKPGAN